MTDIEIEKQTKLKNLNKIIKKNKIDLKYVEFYGKYKAKIDANKINNKQKGKLILVTAINPTKFGEGKTTVSIGLVDAMNKLGKNTILAVREPSLGPVFGIKGGATGGGYSQIVPMEDINLHFNGDFHAISAANNLLTSMIDNSLYFGNPLNIDPKTINFHRCLDLNDRALRNVELNVEGKYKRYEKFNITAASEMMAIMTLSTDINDLKNRIDNILIAFSYSGDPIYARELNCTDAIAILLKEALKPNMVQTLRGNLALVHLGPFANISHGCNSIVATKTALKLADYAVTEAGFGADLGAEKFLDIISREGNFFPDCVVLVITLRAIKLNGGVNPEQVNNENLNAIKQGINIVKKHFENLTKIYNLRVVETINRFPNDSQKEIEYLKNELNKFNIKTVECNPYIKSESGCIELAQVVINQCNIKTQPKFLYNFEENIEDKLEKIVKNLYGAKNLIITEQAQNKLELFKKCGANTMPVVVAKTQYSLTDNPLKVGVYDNFDFTITDFELHSGAGYIVAVAGKMLLMPGLSKIPNAVNMKIDKNNNINGLF